MNEDFKLNAAVLSIFANLFYLLKRQFSCEVYSCRSELTVCKDGLAACDAGLGTDVDWGFYARFFELKNKAYVGDNQCIGFGIAEFAGNIDQFGVFIAERINIQGNVAFFAVFVQEVEAFCGVIERKITGVSP